MSYKVPAEGGTGGASPPPLALYSTITGVKKKNGSLDRGLRYIEGPL